MFEGITRALGDAFKRLRGRGRLTADNIKDGLREVRRAFLEADVNFNVINDFIKKVEPKALGQDVLARVDPSEQIIKIVYEELVQLMGPVDPKIPQRADRPEALPTAQRQQDEQRAEEAHERNLPRRHIACGGADADCHGAEQHGAAQDDADAAHQHAAPVEWGGDGNRGGHRVRGDDRCGVGNRADS